MQTFAKPRCFVDNPRYERDREHVLASLVLDDIDAPIRAIVAGFARLPQCFTLQSCYGHFVHAAQPEATNLAALPARDIGPVTYRIAYVAWCLEDSPAGGRLRAALEEIPAIDPEYVHFGSPEYFWRHHANSYALQVQPLRFMGRDVAIVEHREAVHLQRMRNRFFARLAELVRAERQDPGGG